MAAADGKSFLHLAASALAAPRLGRDTSLGSPFLRILSFNVNGIAARALAPNFVHWVLCEQASVFCAQEVKRRAADLASEFDVWPAATNDPRTLATLFASPIVLDGSGGGNRGIHSSTAVSLLPRMAVAALGDGGAPGVATWLRADVVAIASRCGFPPRIANAHSAAAGISAARIVTTWLREPLELTLVNVYVPNSGSGPYDAKGLASLAARAAWDHAHCDLIAALLAGAGPELWDSDGRAASAGRAVAESAAAGGAAAGGVRAAADGAAAGEGAGGVPTSSGVRLLVIGDLNVCADAGLDIDRHAGRMDPARHVAGDTDAERRGFRALCSLGLHDVWRERNPRARGVTYHNSRWGLSGRFDYALVSAALLPHVADVFSRTDGGLDGDHVPIGIDLRVHGAAASGGAGADAAKGGVCATAGVVLRAQDASSVRQGARVGDNNYDSDATERAEVGDVLW